MLLDRIAYSKFDLLKEKEVVNNGQVPAADNSLTLDMLENNLTKYRHSISQTPVSMDSIMLGPGFPTQDVSIEEVASCKK